MKELFQIKYYYYKQNARFKSTIEARCNDAASSERAIVEVMPRNDETGYKPQVKTRFRGALTGNRKQLVRIERVREMLGADNEDVTKYPGLLAGQLVA